MISLSPALDLTAERTNEMYVDLDKDYTVQSFIEAILSERSDEKGYIRVHKFEASKCEYDHGKIIKNAIPDDIMSKPIRSARAYCRDSNISYVLFPKK